ncbi:Spo0B domain-containing protein [Bacillus sp. SJS]|uniref:Spo0B domain-containing protein n=1 Tax=Bacillus sp. SJS TaxID=1423321 RepID=UPI00068AA2F5|nr:Spo0B domain-containing protein [Bacillus sp. SJS]KZZ84746.1 hypothetical protein AS29_009450 [Bacillus sp. SJS]
MKKRYNFSLQTKIMGLVMIIVSVIITLLVSVFAYLESSDTKEETAKLAIQTAANVAYMPEVRNSLATGNQEEIQGLAELIRDQVDAASVIVTDRHSRIYTHPDASKIGQIFRDPDSEKALVFAGKYSAEGQGSFGPSLKGKAPILLDEGNYQEVSGVVTVEFLEKDIQKKIAGKITNLALYTLPVLAAGIIGSALLARNIRKDTLGLEPSQIAALYRERSAILSSLGEGILALGYNGNVTLMNPAAEEMLGSENRDHWFPKLKHLRQSGGARNAEMSYRDRVLIVNHDIILEKGKAAGMVWTFKDKMEFVKMIDTLSEVKKYSEDLRAQTHEYTNKLYVISRLLELGRTDAALDLINDESVKSQNQNQVLFEQIKDPKLQAILLGKIGKASEKKISFTIDRESSFNKGRSKRLWAFKCKSSGRGAWRMH